MSAMAASARPPAIRRSVASLEVRAAQVVILAVELQRQAVVLEIGKDTRRHGIIERRHPHGTKLFVSGLQISSSAMFLRCMSPSAISHANSARFTMIRTGLLRGRSTAGGRRVRRAPWCRRISRSSADPERSTGLRAPACRVSSGPPRISKRSTTSAGGILSGIATSAVAGASKPAARPSAIAVHSTTGNASIAAWRRRA